MKKSTIITLLAFLFLGVTVIAQEQLHEKKSDLFKRTSHYLNKDTQNKIQPKQSQFSKGQVSRPGNSEDYYWDSGMNTWFHSTNSEYSYNETGQLIERLSTETITGSNMWKDVYSYDSHGEMTESIFYNWYNNAWEISYGSKYENTYDNNGNLTEQVYLWWDYQTNSWQKEWKDIWVYNNNGHITEVISQYWENEAWINNWKEVLTLNTNGAPTELMSYEWEGNDWGPSEKYTDITWNTWSGWNEYGSEPSSYTGQEYDNGQWVNYERYNAIYTGNNYIGAWEVWENGEWINSDRTSVTRSATEETELNEYWDGGQWIKYSRDTETFDDHGNSTGYKYEYWVNDEWEIQYASGMTHTYNDDGDIIETIYTQWDSESMVMVNIERKVYSNHQHFESGINIFNSLTNVSIYPNPVSSSVNIRIDDKDVKSYRVDIINISGQRIYTNSYSILTSAINLENLDGGIYFVRITADNNKTYNYKLIKD